MYIECADEDLANEKPISRAVRHKMFMQAYTSIILPRQWINGNALICISDHGNLEANFQASLQKRSSTTVFGWIKDEEATKCDPEAMGRESLVPWSILLARAPIESVLSCAIASLLG